MKAEEKTVAFMFFSVVMQFVSSFFFFFWGGTKKKQNLGVGEGGERNKRRGIGGPNSSGRQQGTPEVNDIWRITSCNFFNLKL